MRLNACQLFENGTPRISQPCTLLPHLQTLPQHEGEKANQVMRLNAVFCADFTCQRCEPFCARLLLAKTSHLQ
jgi:hypothetical protein